MRFEEKEDCYLDTITGLEWSKDNLGLMDWHAAMNDLPNGWKLPTMEELLTLVNYKKHNPASSLPGMVSSYYWSSTTDVSHSDYAWFVNFYLGDGYWDYKSSSNYVRAVKNQSAFLPDGPDFSIP